MVVSIVSFVFLLFKVFKAPKSSPLDPKKARIAVIGGGIAGTGAAWGLRRAGFKNVTIFEKMATIGGNAKVQHWPTNPPVISGLSVLAWPDEYFHNYNQVSLLCYTVSCSVPCPPSKVPEFKLLQTMMPI